MNVQLIERIQCSECPVRHRAVCARCDDAELARLERIKTYRRVGAGETVYWRGDELRYVSSVVSGVATLAKSMRDGRTQVVGLLLPSDFIGRPGRRRVDFDVTAATDVVLCSFERRGFERLVEESPNLSQRLMEIALDELDAAREWMVLLGRKTAKEKIATFLRMVLRRTSAPEGAGPAATLPLTRDEIANFLGLTLETVSRQLSALKADGVVVFSGRRRFTVPDLAALEAATGDDGDDAEAVIA